MSDNPANSAPVESTYTQLPWDQCGYSQREWDRVVGIGVVPEEYKRKKYTIHDLIRLYDRG
jgi:hypothetical protein